MLQKGLQHLLAPGQLEEDVRGGEGDMQKEAAASVRTLLPQKMRHMHEMIVMDPDVIVRARVFGHSARELPVHVQIACPVRRNEVAARLEVMEQGPDDFI